jgi:prevent-host-death family protein
MSQVTIDEVKRDLPSFLHRVEAGETLVIVKAGKPVAEIKPIPSIPKKPRPFGLCAGEFTVPDDFDAPLPENIIADFEGR